MLDQQESNSPSAVTDGLRAVERILVGLPGIVRAAVVLEVDDDGYEQLTAYAVPVPGESPPSVEELLDHVAAELPPYAVPDTVLYLEELPLTAAGEVDLVALPRPRFPAGVGRPPRTVREELLCELYAGVLGLPKVAVDDNFFGLGGDSLLATRLSNRIRTATGFNVRVRDLFDAQTIASVLELVDGPTDTGLPEAPGSDRGADGVPATPLQRVCWPTDQQPPVAGPPLLAWAVRLSGQLDLDALGLATADTVRRHEALRTVFRLHDRRLHQLVRSAAEVDCEVRVASVPEAGLPQALGREVAQLFDLSAELPWRASLFEVGPDEHVLLWVVHPIAGDAWSLDVIRRDLARAYTARCSGRAPAWELLGVQYPDHARRLSGRLGDEDDPESPFARQVDHWRKLTAELLPREQLCAGSATTAAGGPVPLEIPAALHEDLRAVARKNKATVSMVLQAGVAALLAADDQAGVVPLAVTRSGRDEEALDDVVGAFRTTTPLLVRTAGEPAFAELVAQVRTTALEADLHRDVPFERVLALHDLDGRLSCPQLNRVSLELEEGGRHRPDEPQFAELSATEVPLEPAPPRSDLHLCLAQEFDAEGAPAGVRGEIRYRADRLDEAEARRFGGRLIALLDRAAADPGRTIDDLIEMEFSE